MGTPILAQKSGHGACVASLTAEKQPFPLKSGVRVASVTVTKMDLPVYENRCFFWILMPQGSALPSFFKKGVHLQSALAAWVNPKTSQSGASVPSIYKAL